MAGSSIGVDIRENPSNREYNSKLCGNCVVNVAVPVPSTTTLVNGFNHIGNKTWITVFVLCSTIVNVLIFSSSSDSEVGQQAGYAGANPQPKRPKPESFQSQAGSQVSRWMQNIASTTQPSISTKIPPKSRHPQLHVQPYGQAHQSMPMLETDLSSHWPSNFGQVPKSSESDIEWLL